jgi:putative membrane protein insertion efficiency factor
MKVLSSIINFISKIIVAIFVILIKIYQLVISPWLGPSCRYTPTCSQYGLEAFKKHGVLKGFALTTKRFLSCRPGGGHGWDPVPEIKDN